MITASIAALPRLRPPETELPVTAPLLLKLLIVPPAAMIELVMSPAVKLLMPAMRLVSLKSLSPRSAPKTPVVPNWPSAPRLTPACTRLLLTEPVTLMDPMSKPVVMTASVRPPNDIELTVPSTRIAPW